MKKVLALALAMSMVLALAACGNSSSSSGTGGSASSGGGSTSQSAGSGSGSGSGSVSGSGSSSQPGGEEKAPEDYSGDLVLYSSMTDADLEALTTCFNEVYPNINIEIINGSAGEMTTRLRGEAANPVGDLVWGGMADSDGDVNADIFEAWLSDYEDQLPDEYKSPNGLYSMDHLSTVVFCVNTDLEEELGLEIKSYEDLLDPALTGKVVIADPTSSSSAWNNLCNIMSVYGTDSDEAWAYVEKLMPQLVISNSSSVCFNSVASGEYVVGLTYEDGAVNLLKEGATNVRLQYPEEGTSASVFGTALVKNGPNQENAKAMINFICSPEGETALAAYQQGTLRYTSPDYEVPEGAWLAPSSDIKWVERDVQYLTENHDAIADHWSQIRADAGIGENK